MKFSTMINTPLEARERTAGLEQAGYDALFVNESKHDPFVTATLVADRSTTVEIMSYIAVAFARTPMLAAHSAHDLALLSGGRFTLGLGSQIKPHVMRRFSMPWSHPARRMREYILALHAIWDTWFEGKPLQFGGEFYTHTLTSPMFIPDQKATERPRVMLGAVGPEMTKVAAEMADGLLCHSFTTERYLREVTLPAIERGLTEHGRERAKFRIVGMPFMAVGDDPATLEASICAVRRSIAFYCSTPAYRSVLELHGWGELQPEFLRLSKQGSWQAMGELVTDDMLETFAVVGSSVRCAELVRQRFDGVLDLICGYASGKPELPISVLQSLRGRGS